VYSSSTEMGRDQDFMALTTSPELTSFPKDGLPLVSPVGRKGQIFSDVPFSSIKTEGAHLRLFGGNNGTQQTTIRVYYRYRLRGNV
jgi:hypothetical protein